MVYGKGYYRFILLPHGFPRDYIGVDPVAVDQKAALGGYHLVNLFPLQVCRLPPLGHMDACIVYPVPERLL